MLKQPIIEKLPALRLLGMVEALKTQEHAKPRTNACVEEIDYRTVRVWTRT